MKKYFLLSIATLMLFSAQSQVVVTFGYVTPPLPLVDAGNDSMVYCWHPFTLQGSVTGGTAPYTYLWQPGSYLNDSTILNPTATLLSMMTVTFTLTVTDVNGCEVSDDVVYTCVINSVEDPGLPPIRIFPNPAAGTVYIDGIDPEYSIVDVTCHSLQGKELMHMLLANEPSPVTLNLQSLKPGIYLLGITLNGNRTLHRLTIQ